MRTVLVGVALCWAAIFAIGGWLWLGIALLASGVLELALFSWDRWRRRVSPTETDLISALVWRGLESTPGFNEELRQAGADLAAGEGTPFREVGE